MSAGRRERVDKLSNRSVSVSLSDTSVRPRLLKGWQTPCDAAPARRERTHSAIGARRKRRRVKAEAEVGEAGGARVTRVEQDQRERILYSSATTSASASASSSSSSGSRNVAAIA